jgi:hypothetical protein
MDPEKSQIAHQAQLILFNWRGHHHKFRCVVKMNARYFGYEISERLQVFGICGRVGRAVYIDNARLGSLAIISDFHVKVKIRTLLPHDSRSSIPRSELLRNRRHLSISLSKLESECPKHIPPSFHRVHIILEHRNLKLNGSTTSIGLRYSS